MTGALGELTLACALAVGVLATAASMSQREHGAHAALIERAVAREAAEGLLALVAAAPPAPGRHPLDVTAHLPFAARLPHVSAEVRVAPAGTGLLRVTVQLRWASREAREQIALTTLVEQSR